VPRYATVDDVKLALRSPAEGGWQDGGVWDDAISRALSSAEDLVDQACGRSFDAAPQLASDRIFQYNSGRLLLTDDFVGEPSAVAALPLGRSPGFSLQTWQWAVRVTPTEGGWPSRHLDVLGSGWLNRHRYKVTARFGWPAVPDAIRQASIQLAMRIFREQDAPLGLVKGDDGTMAYVSRSDRQLLEVVGRYGGRGRILR